ncbi:2OG-Fe(II) oxygenase [Pontixanthobacter gangjinensis]|uniref:Fe2OG dioxygenase domain-containing protein n=1 Tax=Pontixanthobacter gangjinensis TaxID=1028742 RepID=A0A6I4SLI9_9SPHN|nr:2OG-Fe(II) oxygenase [Pontixanthobacter gangjinensis]MXO56544.1 hypothetical protein [Pontixanthobacter gangjinensis]
MFTKYAIIDGFLGPEFSAKLLAFAVENERNFYAAGVTSSNAAASVDCDTRNSAEFQGDWGQLGERLRHAFLTRASELFGAAGLAPITMPILEISMVAHQDGGFFRKHVDSLSDTTRRFADADRILSAVYYFHGEPAAFSGGELAILPIAGDIEPVKIAPNHDRLVIFPSFAPHEVLRISVPDNAFSNARFSVNCWFCRPRI